MRHAAGSLLLGLAFTAMSACGSDSGPSTADAGSTDGGSDSGRADGGTQGAPHDAGTDAHADAGPVAAPFGLDARPANTTCLARKRPVLDTGVSRQRMWPGLNLGVPVVLTQAPGDNNHWYVVDLTGKVRVLPTAAATDADVSDFVTVPGVTVGAEAGLLGMAFHPGWQANHEVYLSYTRVTAVGDPPSPPGCQINGDSVFTSIVARFKSKDGGLTLDPTADELIALGQPYVNHNGGNIQFSPIDKMLYIGFGDGGAAGDPCQSGQDSTSLLGKMLRIDVNAGVGKYNVPKDNPFFGSATTRNEIWALGLRNPWRWSFDSVSGDLWVGDVGQSTWEEIDHVVAGGNYGWSTCEGFHKINSTTDLCDTPGFRGPVVEHERAEAQAIVGGYVYRGAAMPSLVGTYIYGDYGTGNIWALTYDANNVATPTLILSVPSGQLVSFAQGNDGEIYMLQINGEIYKLSPAAPPVPDTFPKLLSQTGCVDPNAVTRPAVGMIAYDVNSPLWSDGAEKSRYFAIPDGTKIAIGPDGDWDLPAGSVTMKTFSVGGKRVETRLFMRDVDGWAGYSYEWNDQETEATLLPGSKTKPVNGGAQLWSYPSRTQCMQCHSAATGGTIGLEIAQLNRPMVYATTNRISNELTTLDHLGMFSAPLPGASTLPALPSPAGADPVELRARSYLHANCSHCHRAGGSGQGTMDLRYTASFPSTQTCNVATTQGAIGGSSTLLVPGNAAASVMSLRMHATSGARMPPLAVSIPDALGTKLVDQWINGVVACP